MSLPIPLYKSASSRHMSITNSPTCSSITNSPNCSSISLPSSPLNSPGREMDRNNLASRQLKTREQYKKDMEKLRRVHRKSIEQLQDQLKCVKHVVQLEPTKDDLMLRHSRTLDETSVLRRVQSNGGLLMKQRR